MILNDMKTLITSESTVYIGDMPDSDSVCALFSTGGYDSQHQLGSQAEPSFEQPTFQVVIRDKSYNTGYNRIQAIKECLNGLTNQTINSNTYLNIFLMGDINSLGKDEKNRSEFTINFRVRVKRA